MTEFLRLIPTTGHPSNALSWIHIQDLCRIYLYLMDKKVSGVWNAVAPEGISMKQMVDSIDTAIGRKNLHPNVPCSILKLMLGEMGTLACGSQRVSAEKLLDDGFRYLHPTLQSALNDLLKS